MSYLLNLDAQIASKRPCVSYKLSSDGFTACYDPKDVGIKYIPDGLDPCYLPFEKDLTVHDDYPWREYYDLHRKRLGLNSC